ncbi:MAG: 50S ribosomal protein L18 [Coriobacteriales bacterium]|jgi:large subunit ribosomal protein L18|nr:50S ribosomal protein L18 [Coriobacteriales bacterium]
MDKHKVKAAALNRRQRRVRGKINGTAEIPRLRVTRSNAHIYAQVIDDVTRKTIAAASSLDPEFKKQDKNGATVEGAQVVGELIGQRVLDAKVKTVVFDRGGYIYHGRIKALADGARSAGLEF